MRTLALCFHTFLAGLLLLAAIIMFSFWQAPGGYRSFVVLSGSMVPAIAPGSLIVVRPATAYQVGDIVTRTTSDPAVTITHRIIEVTDVSGERRFRTQGDANLTADAEWVPEGSLLGRVQWTIPALGKVVSYAKTKQGFLLMVVVPSVLIIIEEAISIVATLKARRRMRRTPSLDHLKVL